MKVKNEFETPNEVTFVLVTAIRTDKVIYTRAQHIFLHLFLTRWIQNLRKVKLNKQGYLYI